MTKDELIKKYSRSALAVKELLSDFQSCADFLLQGRSFAKNPNVSTIGKIFKHKTFLLDLLESKLISADELSYLFDNSTQLPMSDILKLSENLPLLEYVVKNALVSYKTFSKPFYSHEIYKSKMLNSNHFVENVLFDKYRRKQWSLLDLLDFGMSDSTNKSLRKTYFHTQYYVKLFRDFSSDIDPLVFIEFFKEKKAFSDFLRKSFMLHELFDSKANESLKLEYIKRILDNIENTEEMFAFTINFDDGFFLKPALQNFLFTVEHITKLNEFVREVVCDERSWYRKRYFNLDEIVDQHNTMSFFQFLENEYTDPRLLKVHAIDKENAQEIVELTRVYMALCSFLNDNNFMNLVQILSNSERSREVLKQIVFNNLIDQYDFESLQSILTKDEKKMKNKMNF